MAPTRFPTERKLSDHHATDFDLEFAADFPRDQPLAYTKSRKRKADQQETPSFDSKAPKTDKQLAATVSRAIESALTAPTSTAPRTRRPTPNKSPQELYNHLRHILDAVCEDHLPKKTRLAASTTWYKQHAPELKRASRAVSALRKGTKLNPYLKPKLKDAIRKYQRLCRRARSMFWSKIAKEINKAFGRNQHQRFHSLIKDQHATPPRPLEKGYQGARDAV